MDRPTQTLFGPVPSRRLGRSLGIDVIPPKTCTYDCVYCESGRTNHLTTRRQEFVPAEQVMDDLKSFFAQREGTVDVLTFSSAGEPTLYLGLGELIERIKSTYPDLPLIVLTNGALLWDPDVRSALMLADRVVPSLDAATVDVFRRVDRPHPGLELTAVLEGLYAFRKEYRGQFHLEVLLVRGVNDASRELTALRRIIDRVDPHWVELNTVVRPPACPGVQGLTQDEMTKAAGFFPADKTRIIGRFESTVRCQEDVGALEERIVQLVTRRPGSAEEMAVSLGVPLETLREALSRLVRAETLRSEAYGEKVFYCPASRA